MTVTICRRSSPSQYFWAYLFGAVQEVPSRHTLKLYILNSYQTGAYLLSSAQHNLFKLEDSNNIPNHGRSPQPWSIVLPHSHQHVCLFRRVRYRKRSILANDGL